jgi:hypothetical protein
MAQPVKIIRNGCCSASIFENEVQKNGKMMKVTKVTVNKSYKNGQGWKATNSFEVNDLPKLFFVACKAYDYLTDKKNNQPD